MIDNRTVKFLGHVHHSHCLAVPFGLGHRKIAMPTLVNIAALLLPNYANLGAVEPRKSGYHRRVVRKPPVAMHLNKVRKNRVENIHRIRPVGMPRHLDAFKCSCGHS